MKKQMSIKEQLKDGLQFMKDLNSGKADIKTMRTTTFKETQEHFQPEEIKHLREDVLKVSQAVLAKSLSVSLRTVQAWEIGNNSPSGSSAKLLHLMVEMPSVRRRLIV
jgi:DNA-binding transcriptional regulator YiaG